MVQESRPDWRTRSPRVEATLALGERVGRLSYPGLVLDLRGDLGAGKTHFVRGLAAGLGVTEGVSSPTFAILQIHEGRLPLYHLDAYRLRDPSELLIHGWDDFRDRVVVAVEWGGRLGEYLPDERLTITLEHEGESARALEFLAHGERAEGLLAELAADSNSD